MKSVAVAVVAGLALAGCVGVRQEDQAAWRGRPLSDLELHPVFNTMRVVKTQASDGTQIWNYVNGAAVSRCSGDGFGTVFRGTLTTAQYSEFTSCMARVAACNNIFYVKGGRVLDYVPVGSGGAVCYTDDRTRPGFRGATNFV